MLLQNNPIIEITYATVLDSNLYKHSMCEVEKKNMLSNEKLCLYWLFNDWFE